MSARPGRIDRIIKFGPLDKEGMIKMCGRILPNNKAEWERLVAQGLANTDSPAQFQERCVQVALAELRRS